MATTPTLSQPTKVILPYVRSVPEEIKTRLDPFILALHRQRCEMLHSFKLALEAAGVEYMEADHD